MFFKAAQRIKEGVRGFCCSRCFPCHCHRFRGASAKGFVVLRQVLTLCSSCSLLGSGSPCLPLSRAHIVCRFLHSTLCNCILFCKCSLSPLLVSLAASWMTGGKLPVTATSYWWEFLSYKTALRLFQMLISAKPFKASMACKEYSAVFLSLRINKDKTAIRVKCPALLSVWLMLNLKGRGVRTDRQQQQLILTIVSAEASVKDVLCPQAVDVPKV